MEADIVEAIGRATLTTNLSAVVSALATLVLAILTFIYVRLTKKILNNQADPCVIVSVINSDNRPTILQLVVRNIGQGVARDIKFIFSRPIPARAFGISEKAAKEANLMKDGPLIDGIPALGPGESRIIDWGQYGGLKKAIQDDCITATCTFFKNKKKMKPTICELDIKSFIGTVASDKPIVRIANDISEIHKAMDKLVQNTKIISTKKQI